MSDNIGIEIIVDENKCFFGALDSKQVAFLEQFLTWIDKGDRVSLLFQDVNGSYFTLPGLAKPISDKSGIKIKEDYRLKLGERPVVSKNVLKPYGNFKELLPFQVAAIEKAVWKRKGIIRIPTGGGKAWILLALVKHLLDQNLIKTGLIIVPNVGLVEDIKDRALNSGFTSDQIGCIHSSSKDVDRPITIAVVDSLNNALKKHKLEICEIIQNADIVIFDEVHSLRSDKFLNVALEVKAEYLLGFGATPYHSEEILDNLGDSFVCGVTGGVIFDIPSSYLVKVGLNAKSNILFKTLPGQNQFFPIRYATLYDKYIVKNKLRNEYIVKSAKKAVNLGFKVLISVARLNHARSLMLDLKGHRVICVFGGNKGLKFGEGDMVDNCTIDHTVLKKNFASGMYEILIASQVFDVGMDMPSIGFVIIAGAMKSKIKVIQRRGRGIRAKKEGPNVVHFIDFIDRSHVYLSSQSYKRRNLYKEEGSNIEKDEGIFWSQVIEHGQILKELKDSGDIDV